jgi:flagellar basal-body rod protein FlgC
MNTSLSIAVSGIEASFRRIEASANNIANINTVGRLPATRGEVAGSYQPQRAVSLPVSDGQGGGLGVRTVLQPYEPAYYVAQQPDSPYANEQGLVAAPNVDLATEIIESKMAEIAYRANAQVIKAESERSKYLYDILA